MDLQGMRAFRSVVATGSVRAAAAALQYSPSAVSQQVTSLQRDIGVPLLAKSGRGLEPTAAGRALAKRLDAFLEEVGDLDNFVTDLRSERDETFTLSYFASLGASWLPQIVGALGSEFPDARIDLRLSDVFLGQTRPRPDVQFLVPGDDLVTPSEYIRHDIAVDPFVVVLPEGHELQGEDSVSLERLSRETWIDNDFVYGTCRGITLEACAAVGYQPSFRVQSHDYATAIELVAVGMGITVLPELGVQRMPAGVVVRPISPMFTRTISALVLRTSADRPMVRRTVELAQDAALTLSTATGIHKRPRL